MAQEEKPEQEVMRTAWIHPLNMDEYKNSGWEPIQDKSTPDGVARRGDAVGVQIPASKLPELQARMKERYLEEKYLVTKDAPDGLTETGDPEVRSFFRSGVKQPKGKAGVPQG